MKDVRIGDIVKCCWLDAYSPTTVEDLTLEDIQKCEPCKMTSYGILVRDDRPATGPEEMVGLAAEHYEDSYRGVTFIPAAMVVSVERVMASPRTSRKANRSPQAARRNTADTPLPEQK